jgi:hypothetical protein
MTFFIKRFTLDRAWSGLTDDEFFWQPTPDTWSVRPVSERCTATPWVSGEWEADYDTNATMSGDWSKDGEPLTNIAWLYWHIGSMPGRAAELDFLGGTHTAACGWTSPYFSSRTAPHPIFTTADEAVTTMRAGWKALVTALGSATDEQLEQPTKAWGSGEDRTAAQILASVINEVSHHGTQICALRDFYRLRNA